MGDIFVITSHIPTVVNCMYLTATLNSIIKYHSRAKIIVVDNASPFNNVDRVLDKFKKIQSIHHVRQNQSLLQLGSWKAANVYIKGYDYTRVITLQHSTVLKHAVPIQSCAVMPLSHPKRSSFLWKETFEGRRFGAMWFTSRVLEDLGIDCAQPCFNSSTLLPANSSRTWHVIPHSSMAFSKQAWIQLDVFLSHPKMLDFFDAVSQSISAREFNGHTERLSGILQLWINKEQSCTNQNILQKKHGKTMTCKERSNNTCRSSCIHV